MVERAWAETSGRTLWTTDGVAGLTFDGERVTRAEEGGAAAGVSGVVLREEAEELGDSDFADGLFLSLREFELAEGEAEFAAGEFVA
jgi:hypothetical protein